ncbi:DMT family transporter [Bacillus massiliigorillae]|uniref:DMT family transporter n=1 Tax=Bacillus massiliigorillae TaxID=1243664 RepID=UPI0003A00955|nr:EamA family transporter [Bacillus massiliigorillae]
MKNNSVLLYSCFIMGAAFCWGIISVFVKGLTTLGFSAMEIVTIRVMVSCFLLFLYGYTMKRKEMKIAFKDTYLFIGTGILSMAFFNWASFTSMNMISVSVSVILLYTAPAFVMVMSVMFLREKLTTSKIILLCMTLVGCLLVTGLKLSTLDQGNMLGYIIGIGSGFGYALYSIFGKFAIRKYSSFTVSFYTFLVASIALIPYTRIWEKFSMLMNMKALIYVLGLCLFSTVLAYLLYTEGLKVIESSKASILATVEPLTAMIIGIIVFQESITAIQIVGGAIIFVSAILASVDVRKLIKKSQIIS